MSEPARTDASGEAPAPSRWPKRLVIWGLVLLPIVALSSVYIIIEIGGAWALREAMEEADRLDPGWRLEELEAKRAEIPDAENSAKHILAIMGVEGAPSRMRPGRWRSEELGKLLENLRPQIQLNEQQLKFLREDLQKISPVVIELRKLKDIPRGRYPIRYAPDGMSTLLPHVQGNREVAHILCEDALLLAQEGKIDEALASCRAALNAARSIGDEPTLISMLVRIACEAITISRVERVLSQGQASEAALAALQKLLEDEASQPLLLFGARGERGMSDRTVQSLQSGMTSLSSLSGGSPASGWGSQFLDRLAGFFVSMKKQRAEVLRYNTRFVEVAKMPVQEQKAPLEELTNDAKDGGILVRLLAPAAEKVGEAFRRSQTSLQSAAAILAAERYRKAHGQWPASFEQLVPRYLAKVPDDPYAKTKLKLRRVQDGIVIYSVGPNGKDDGGNLDREKGGRAPDSDLGFQLWDVEKRRQPAKPSAKPMGNDEP